MKFSAITCLFLGLSTLATAAQPSAGDGAVKIEGELKQWHKVTLSLNGPYARERDTQPNPFTDYRFTVIFTHESGQPVYRIPGYFAADGDAANTSAEEGSVWRAHLSPDKPGRWIYKTEFAHGPHAALENSGSPLAPFDGLTGSFIIAPTDKGGRDFRAHGRLGYVGERYLRFAGSGEYFLKVGADSPENLLGYADIDGTRSNCPGTPARPGEAAPPLALKTWAPHLRDWRPGDPVWRDGKGRGLIGALNYLAGTGSNSVSFLTYNAGGDGDDVWPFVERDNPLHYDCSKLDQWQIIFAHATALGLHLHFKLQETENDDNRTGNASGTADVPTALDGGDTGPERRLYLRELIARFGHELALNWNLGEENTMSTAQQQVMAQYIADTDPYDHPIVLHTYPNRQEDVYRPLLGDRSALTGLSLQNSWEHAHRLALQWIEESTAAGRPWVVANDEQNPHYTGVPPDPGWEGFDGTARPEKNSRPYTSDDIRKFTLWGTLLAGGGGVEYYFGYTLPQNDLNCQDWRSRAQSWAWGGIALRFFRDQQIPFWKMANADALVGNPNHDNRAYCFAQPGEIYLVYLPAGGTAALDLAGVAGVFSTEWFNPREGGALLGANEMKAGGKATLTAPSANDWMAVLRRK